MGVYWYAIDFEKKQIIDSGDFNNHMPGILHPKAPFCAMVCLKNGEGMNFKIVSDISQRYIYEYEDHMDQFENVTKKVYEELLEIFPWSKQLYEE